MIFIESYYVGNDTDQLISLESSPIPRRDVKNINIHDVKVPDNSTLVDVNIPDNSTLIDVDVPDDAISDTTALPINDGVPKAIVVSIEPSHQRSKVGFSSFDKF